MNDFALLSQYVPDNYGKAKVKSKAISQANMHVSVSRRKFINIILYRILNNRRLLCVNISLSFHKRINRC